MVDNDTSLVTHACNLKKGNKVDICGWTYRVTKIEEVFYYKPAGRIRISLTGVCKSSKNIKAILFLAPDTLVEILT